MKPTALPCRYSLRARVILAASGSLKGLKAFWHRRYRVAARTDVNLASPSTRPEAIRRLFPSWVGSAMRSGENWRVRPWPTVRGPGTPRAPVRRTIARRHRPSPRSERLRLHPQGLVVVRRGHFGSFPSRRVTRCITRFGSPSADAGARNTVRLSMASTLPDSVQSCRTAFSRTDSKNADTRRARRSLGSMHPGSNLTRLPSKAGARSRHLAAPDREEPVPQIVPLLDRNSARSELPQQRRDVTGPVDGQRHIRWAHVMGAIGVKGLVPTPIRRAERLLRGAASVGLSRSARGPPVRRRHDVPPEEASLVPDVVQDSVSPRAQPSSIACLTNRPIVSETMFNSYPSWAREPRRKHARKCRGPPQRAFAR